jgi:hypothetical protein
MIYRKVIEMYYIDGLLMSILALLSRPGFFWLWIEIGSWIVCILLALPGGLQRCTDWRANPHRSDPYEP